MYIYIYEYIYIYGERALEGKLEAAVGDAKVLLSHEPVGAPHDEKAFDTCRPRT